jgi:Ni/Fe-hydrogenase subunit HybB-like protein
MSSRQTAVKTVLWTIMGVFAVVTIARFANGLGAVTHLSDAAPWGLWIALDVMAGVALAAGGFTLAATVYIFGLERYRPFVRPAILTAFLGYAAVAVGLMYDLGLPWHIWHPIVYPQLHSVLFEVAMCVMLYLTVLALEFSPVVLEHRWFDRPVFRTVHRLLKRATIPLVIAGIMLSTLHQSSLGSLFLITPYRLHPLWYSPIIWILFFISAVGVGLMMVTLESCVSAWLFHHERRADQLAGLGLAASVVLLLYAGLRLGDLAWRSQLRLALQPTSMAALFWFELAVSALVPGVLLAIAAVRRSARGLGMLALMAVLGIIGYRFDVAVVAFSRPAGASYFPSWIEVAVSAGIVAGAALIFLFFVERLRVYPEEPRAEQLPVAVRHIDPYGTRPLLPSVLAVPRRYSMGFVIGAALALAFLPRAGWLGATAMREPVSPARVVPGVVRALGATPGYHLAVMSAGAQDARVAASVGLLEIDGNRDGRVVLFPHDLHEADLGGAQSCVMCHHANLPFRRNTACAGCHRDMYSPTDVFDHGSHAAKLGGNGGCVRCHPNSELAKTRATATPCDRCHADMQLAGSRVRPARTFDGRTISYVDAMHRLCIGCHTELHQKEPAKHPADFALCGNCHRDAIGSSFQQLAPYAVVEHDVPSSTRVGG